VIADKLEKTHSPRDLFLGDLSAMLEVEKQIAKSLPKRGDDEGRDEGHQDDAHCTNVRPTVTLSGALS